MTVKRIKEVDNMTSKLYKDYVKVPCRLPEQPEVLKMVDTLHGVVYVNLAAQPGANVVLLLSDYGAEYCYRS